MLVLPAVRQRVGIPERLHFLLAHPLTTGGYRAGCEQPHRENELTRPDVVDGDVLPDHLGDVGVDLHPAVLAVLGVLPGQEPVPIWVELRGHLDRRLADGEHAAAEVKVLGVNEISSQYRVPVDTPSRAKTLADWYGSAA